jgi:hypothetical protein
MVHNHCFQMLQAGGCFSSELWLCLYIETSQASQCFPSHSRLVEKRQPCCSFTASHIARTESMPCACMQWFHCLSYNAASQFANMKVMVCMHKGASSEPVITGWSASHSHTTTCATCGRCRPGTAAMHKAVELECNQLATSVQLQLHITSKRAPVCAADKMTAAAHGRSTAQFSAYHTNQSCIHSTPVSTAQDSRNDRCTKTTCCWPAGGIQSQTNCPTSHAIQEHIDSHITTMYLLLLR